MMYLPYARCENGRQQNCMRAQHSGYLLLQSLVLARRGVLTATPPRRWDSVEPEQFAGNLVYLATFLIQRLHCILLFSEYSKCTSVNDIPCCWILCGLHVQSRLAACCTHVD